MSSILEGVATQLDGGVIDRLSQQIGADPSTTATAVQMALPVILGGLARNASTPEGAGALDAALGRDHDGSLLDNLGGLLGGMLGASPAANGAGILAHILGGRQDTVAGGIERSTGLGRSQVLQLLLALAPIVMAYLGRRKREQGLDSAGVSDALVRERERIETRQPGLGGLLDQLFDQNHDGSVIDDVARMAPGVLGGMFGRSS